MTFKKFLSIFLAVLMLLSVVPLTAFCTDIVASGKCGTNVNWSLSSDGCFLLTGSGKMRDWYRPEGEGYSGVPWYRYGDEIINIIVSSGITYIGNYTFVFQESYESEEPWVSNLVSVTIPKSVTGIGEGAFDGTNLTDVYYEGTEEQWNNITIRYDNTPLLKATIHYNSELAPTNYIYNLGEETYRFENFIDDDSYGHCFGMSVTSSGYYLGLLNKSNIGLSDSDSLYSLGLNATVKAPICHYQAIQGKARDESIVAGGTYFKYWPFYNAKSDWKEIVDYVKNHEHDGAGDLIIGYTKKSEGCHAINFLRYEVVDGQERIYAYDSNFPDKETYFYQDVNDYIRQAVRSTFSGSIDCIALVDVNEFYSRTGNFIMAKTFYAPANSITIEGAYASPMCVSGTTEEIMMYEILEDDIEVIITPLVENATFTYMGDEYTFDEIDEDTYAKFTLSESEKDEPIFEIVNVPAQECEHSYEEVRTEPTCTETGSITYTCSCGDTYTETLEVLGHTEELVNEKAATATTDGYTGDTVCSVCDELIESGKVIPATGTPVNSCGHMCHKSGFVGFIWKIVQFFWKLFKMNPICECGAAHY